MMQSLCQAAIVVVLRVAMAVLLAVEVLEVHVPSSAERLADPAKRANLATVT
jgi:hypothetical protein